MYPQSSLLNRSFRVPACSVGRAAAALPLHAFLALLVAVVCAGAVAAQTAPPPSSGDAGEILQLWPFEVVSDTRGYYGANTMSGTRFNSMVVAR